MNRMCVGKTLLVAEDPQGLLLAWLLFRDSAPADSGLLPTAVVRLEEAYGRPKAIAADRGFDSHDNQEALEGDRILPAALSGAADPVAETAQLHSGAVSEPVSKDVSRESS